jgi:hypothetical protein
VIEREWDMEGRKQERTKESEMTEEMKREEGRKTRKRGKRIEQPGQGDSRQDIQGKVQRRKEATA